MPWWYRLCLLAIHSCTCPHCSCCQVYVLFLIQELGQPTWRWLAKQSFTTTNLHSLNLQKGMSSFYSISLQVTFWLQVVMVSMYAFYRSKASASELIEANRQSVAFKWWGQGSPGDMKEASFWRCLTQSEEWSWSHKAPACHFCGRECCGCRRAIERALPFTAYVYGAE